MKKFTVLWEEVKRMWKSIDSPENKYEIQWERDKDSSGPAQVRKGGQPILSRAPGGILQESRRWFERTTHPKSPNFFLSPHRRWNCLRDHLMTRPEWVLKKSHHPSWHVCLSKVVIIWATSSVHKRAEKIIADFIYIMLWAWPGKGLEWVEDTNRREDDEPPSFRPSRPHLKAFNDDSSRRQPMFRCHRLNLTELFIRGLVIASPEKRLALISDLPLPLFCFPIIQLIYRDKTRHKHTQIRDTTPCLVLSRPRFDFCRYSGAAEPLLPHSDPNK